MKSAVRSAAVRSEDLPRDDSSAAIRSSKGLHLENMQDICMDSVVAMVAQLVHHCSAKVREELLHMMDAIHLQHGVCSQYLIPLSGPQGSMWPDVLLRALAKRKMGLLMPTPVYTCAHAHLLQVQWTDGVWQSQAYSFQGRDVCVVAGPWSKTVTRAVFNVPNEQFHVGLPCPEEGP